MVFFVAMESFAEEFCLYSDHYQVSLKAFCICRHRSEKNVPAEK